MDATSTNLYRLLYDALIEIRAEAHVCGSQKAFHLSDLLHTLPLRLERMGRGEISPEDVMQWLHARTSEKGLEQWLEQRVREAVQDQRNEDLSSGTDHAND